LLAGFNWLGTADRQRKDGSPRDGASAETAEGVAKMAAFVCISRGGGTLGKAGSSATCGGWGFSG